MMDDGAALREEPGLRRVVDEKYRFGDIVRMDIRAKFAYP
jgi:hypothetical protein